MKRRADTAPSGVRTKVSSVSPRRRGERGGRACREAGSIPARCLGEQPHHHAVETPGGTGLRAGSGHCGALCCSRRTKSRRQQGTLQTLKRTQNVRHNRRQVCFQSRVRKESPWFPTKCAKKKVLKVLPMCRPQAGRDSVLVFLTCGASSSEVVTCLASLILQQSSISSACSVYMSASVNESVLSSHWEGSVQSIRARAGTLSAAHPALPTPP